ncbi:hypothetical protein LV780_04670 [Cereibacter azotoformans]|uniref:hypothetical protein n=1 Tax=Cereibacter azotoformans TaxID=43057 RepID=UPI000E35E484|nr:hypothetical protein [Cereibacter azotoformans]AXQ93165.1 hypothetical protein D0Z66_04670 [Cereibacter sphaeroides]UIJ31475.1 hypothetical protein LV780_04670 [Cereibacter azotoformans]
MTEIDTSKPKAFVVCVVAEKLPRIGYRMQIVSARNQDEAVGFALRAFEKKEPEWQFSAPSATEVTHAALSNLGVIDAERDAFAAENDRLRDELRLAEEMYLTLEKMHIKQTAALTEARAETGALIERDPARILKDAIFAILKIGTAPVTYGGVLVEPGRWARIRFDTYGENEHNATAALAAWRKGGEDA